MLTNPPRTRGESDSKIPMTPKKIATSARINPENAPTNKLATAAQMAMIAGILKCALLCTLSMP